MKKQYLKKFIRAGKTSYIAGTLCEMEAKVFKNRQL
jgi:hypothetical protein